MRVLGALAAVLILLGAAPAALATGGDQEMEDAAMKAQPARTLAQQALVVLDVRNGVEEARARIDAALESDDQDDVDIALVRGADAALDEGDSARAKDLLNRALGGEPLPLDEETGVVGGAALHNAGRAFSPSGSDQESVAAIVGAALLAAGVGLLVRHRRALGSSGL